MRCSKARRLLWELVDGSLGDEARAAVEGHCARCPACASVREEIEKTSELIAMDAGGEPPEGYNETLWLRIRGRLGVREAAARPAAVWRPALVLAASAAVLLLLVALYGVLIPSGRSTPGRSGEFRPRTLLAKAAPVPAAAREAAVGGDFVVGPGSHGHRRATDYVLTPVFGRRPATGRPGVSYVLASATGPGAAPGGPFFY